MPGSYRTLLEQASTVADKVDTALEADGSSDWQFTSLALENGGVDAAGVRAAVGLASADLDSQLATIDSTWI